LLILAFPEGRGLADLFMLFRETIFFVIGIPAIYLTLRSILFLRRGAIASSRIFLRREMMIKASRLLLSSSIIGGSWSRPSLCMEHYRTRRPQDIWRAVPHRDGGLDSPLSPTPKSCSEVIR